MIGGPTPITGILLLASPFVGMMSGNQLYPEWRISITELAQSGREQQILLQAVNEKDAFSIRSVVFKASGLKAGQKKSDGEIELLREEKLVKLEGQLDTVKKNLLAKYEKGALCNLPEDNNDIEVSRYQDLLLQVNGLRKTLDLGKSEPSICD